MISDNRVCRTEQHAGRADFGICFKMPPVYDGWLTTEEEGWVIGRKTVAGEDVTLDINGSTADVGDNDVELEASVPVSGSEPPLAA